MSAKTIAVAVVALSIVSIVMGVFLAPIRAIR